MPFRFPPPRYRLVRRFSQISPRQIRVYPPRPRPDVRKPPPRANDGSSDSSPERRFRNRSFSPFLAATTSCTPVRVDLGRSLQESGAAVPCSQTEPGPGREPGREPAPDPAPAIEPEIGNKDPRVSIGIYHSDVFRDGSPAICLYTPIPAPASEHKPACVRLGASIMANWLALAVAPTADTAGTVVLMRGERKSYAFGRISEGTQRAMAQRKIGMTSLGNMFVTGPVGCESVGGLIGSLLTVTDTIAAQKLSILETAEKKKARGTSKSIKNPCDGVLDGIHVHAGRNMNHFFAMARHFVFRYGTAVAVHEHRDDPRMGDPANEAHDWEDENIMVWKVPIEAPEPPSRKRSHDDMLGDDRGLPQATEEDPETAREQANADFEAVRAVVDHIFNSNWKRDMLVESTLGQVGLPATVFIRDENGTVKKYEGPMPGQDGFDPSARVWVREPWPGAKVPNLPRTTPSRTSMSYIVRHQPRRGKFDANRAVELGVPRHQNKTLCAGKSVQVGDTTITPDMVLDAPNLGHGFAVVDIPDRDFVAGFLSRPEFGSATIMNTVRVMTWILGPGVVGTPEIQQFMRDTPHMDHIVSSPETSPNVPSIESLTRAIANFHRIDPARFPLLDHDGTTQQSQGQPFESVKVGKTIRIMPNYAQDESEVVNLEGYNDVETPHPRVRRMTDEAFAAVQSQQFQDEVDELEKDIPNRDTEIYTLGTGSAVPSKYRNVSGTLVRVPGHGNYLLDCGEGTLGSLRRLFGFDGAAAVLRDLRCVVISHPHADHHLGTASLMRAWAAETMATPESRLTLVCNEDMARYFREYHQMEDLSLARVRFISNLPAVPGGPSNVYAGSFSDSPTRLSRVVRVAVNHCKFAYATVLEWPTGLRIAYSGDCRPSADFAEVARGCTLLIHEATLDDDHRADAIAKKHSTMTEALGVARDMKARRVILTHFSQRFAKMPNMERPVLTAERPSPGPGLGGEEKAVVRDQQVVLMAFDMMRVKLGEFRHADKFAPAIRKHFEVLLLHEDEEKLDPSTKLERRETDGKIMSHTSSGVPLDRAMDKTSTSKGDREKSHSKTKSQLRM